MCRFRVCIVDVTIAFRVRRLRISMRNGVREIRTLRQWMSNNMNHWLQKLTDGIILKFYTLFNSSSGSGILGNWILQICLWTWRRVYRHLVCEPGPSVHHHTHTEGEFRVESCRVWRQLLSVGHGWWQLVWGVCGYKGWVIIYSTQIKKFVLCALACFPTTCIRKLSCQNEIILQIAQTRSSLHQSDTIESSAYNIHVQHQHICDGQ
jgi:hypothetical protein